jgi:hypothetical protein
MRTFTIAVFLACVVAALVLWYTSRRDPVRVAPIGELLDAVFADRAPRVALVVFWWWLGWHFLVGQTVDP